MNKIETDVVIIGAGTAGYNAFREARKHTDKVLLVNKGHWGTTCAMEGCMPSKLLIGASENAHQFDISKRYGVNLGKPEIDRKGVMDWMQYYRKKWAFGLHDRATQPSDNEYYNNAIHGEARFINENTLDVEGQIIEFKSAVLSTGSTPFIPNNLNFKNTLTTDTIFNLPELPKSLAIVGAGVIALELGQCLSRLGVRVKFFTRDGNVGRFNDPKIKALAKEIFNDELIIYSRPDMNEETFKGFDYVLVAAGRKPNMLEGLEVNLEDRVMSSTNHDNIFIAGDVNGQITLQHEAADEGRIAGMNAGRVAVGASPRNGKLRAPIGIVFTDPQIMSVGNPYNEEYQVGEIDWSNQGRSNVMQKTKGLTRLYAKDGMFMGAEGIGPDQEHHAHLLAWAFQMNMSIEQMLSMPFYHPVTLEGIRTALKDIK